MSKRGRFGCGLVGVTAALLLIAGLLPVCKTAYQASLDKQLIAAVKRNDTDAAISLLNRGANANAPDVPEQNLSLRELLLSLLHRQSTYSNARVNLVPLQLLTLHWHDEQAKQTMFPSENVALLKALLMHGANVNVSNVFGDTPLICAAREGRGETVQLLIAHGANINADNGSCSNVWEEAVYEEHISVIATLLNCGVDVNTRMGGSETALMIAVERQNSEMVRFLLQHHANPRLKDVQNDTALTLARQQLQLVSYAPQGQYTANLAKCREIISLMQASMSLP